mmetsp:Transcript_24860/g.72829  ORF Transcript_24860/g.72829 Transcript_24860/m.72829 type:complete len:223 (+) Transcript_24860:3451-4119(+)
MIDDAGLVPVPSLVESERRKDGFTLLDRSEEFRRVFFRLLPPAEPGDDPPPPAVVAVTADVSFFAASSVAPCRRRWEGRRRRRRGGKRRCLFFRSFLRAAPLSAGVGVAHALAVAGVELFPFALIFQVNHRQLFFLLLLFVIVAVVGLTDAAPAIAASSPPVHENAIIKVSVVSRRGRGGRWFGGERIIASPTLRSAVFVPLFVPLGLNIYFYRTHVPRPSR